MNDILLKCNGGEEYLAFGLEGQLSEALPTFSEIYVARKDKRKIKSRALVRKISEGRKKSK